VSVAGVSDDGLYEAKILRVGNGTKRFSWRGFFVIVASAVLAGVTVLVGVQKNANPLATALLQAFTFIVSIFGAYIFAKDSVAAAAQEVAEGMVRNRVRSAWRRQRGLYQGLGRLIDEIDVQGSETSDEVGKLRLKILRAMITEQTGVSGDALEDWRDLVPDEVAELERATIQAEGDLEND
jgi:hypothetical protein